MVIDWQWKRWYTWFLFCLPPACHCLKEAWGIFMGCWWLRLTAARWGAGARSGWAPAPRIRGGLQEERLETEPSFGECLPPRPRGFESTMLLGAAQEPCVRRQQPRSGAACLSGEGTARQDGFSLRPRTLWAAQSPAHDTKPRWDQRKSDGKLREKRLCWN